MWNPLLPLARGEVLYPADGTLGAGLARHIEGRHAGVVLHGENLLEFVRGLGHLQDALDVQDAVLLRGEDEGRVPIGILPENVEESLRVVFPSRDSHS